MLLLTSQLAHINDYPLQRIFATEQNLGALQEELTLHRYNQEQKFCVEIRRLEQINSVVMEYVHNLRALANTMKMQEARLTKVEDHYESLTHTILRGSGSNTVDPVSTGDGRLNTHATKLNLVIDKVDATAEYQEYLSSKFNQPMSVEYSSVPPQSRELLRQQLQFFR
jgi:hypothetical protein